MLPHVSIIWDVQSSMRWGLILLLLGQVCKIWRKKMFEILIKEQKRITLAEKGFCTSMLLYFRAQCATDSIQLNNSLSNKQWQYTEHHTTSLLWLKVIPVCDWTTVKQKPPTRGWKQEKTFTSYSRKKQGTNWQRKFRLHIPHGVVLFLVQFENSISTTLVFSWKRLSWESSHCLSKGSSEKAAIPNVSKQNNSKETE